jgi:hypothetical protein
LVTPVESGGTYELNFGETVFEVDPAVGARIVTFSLGGQNVLNTTHENYGSTFWPSPQSGWGWPPPAEIDSGAYAPSVASDILTLTGTANADVGISVTKNFSASTNGDVVVIEYEMNNDGTEPVSWAPWQISRVSADGLTFFPMGPGGTYAHSTFTAEAATVTETDGVAWVTYGTTELRDPATDEVVHLKLFADGAEGWLAHVDGDVLFIKQFPDIPEAEQAMGEGEIELYTEPLRAYVEIEPQGAFEEIAPGASSSWTVRWYVRTLPSTITAEPGSAALVDLVRETIQ